MSRPGERLRALAARFCDERTMASVVDPLLADLQLEHAEARRRGQVWRSRWILVTGYVAFVKSIALCEAGQWVPSPRTWTTEDRSVLGRTLRVSVAAVVIGTVLFEVPLLWRLRQTPIEPQLWFYFIPSQLVMSIPSGVLLGILIGFRGRTFSRQALSAIVASAVVWSLVCLATLAWIVPLANQRFRQVMYQIELSAARRFEDPQARRRALTTAEWNAVASSRGFNELTIGELGEKVDAFRGVYGPGDPPSRRTLGFYVAYHERWALALATLCLGLFALVTSRRIVSNLAVALTTLTASSGYYVLASIGRALASSGQLPPVAGAWLANAVVALATVALLRTTIAGAHRQLPKSID